MWFSRLPITAKLRLIITAACLVVVGLTCTAFVTYEWFTFRRDTVRMVTIQARIVAANATAALAFRDAADAEEILGALRTDPDMAAAVIFDGAGREFARFPAALPPGSVAARPVTAPEHAFSGERLTVWVPIQQAGKPLGLLAVQQSLASLFTRLKLYAVIAAGLMLLSALAAYSLASIFHRAVSEPILALARAAHVVAEKKDYTVRADKRGDDELGFLTDAFNGMLARIQEREVSLATAAAQNAALYAQVQRHADELEQRVAERTAALEAANKELEAFSYSVSHDLRAPLRALAGFSDILREDYEKALPPEAQRYLDLIQKSARTMGRLIDDLLNFSRLSRQTLAVRPVDIGRMFREVVDELQGEEAARRAEVTIAELPPGLADPPLLRQVIVNLLTNALKYSRTRTPPRIEIGVTAPDHGGQAYFVKDNGVGFDMQYANKLFGVFQRLHRAEEFEGTGVGLANVQRIIQRHGGHIWAQAAPDAGATFFFTLPGEPPHES